MKVLLVHPDFDRSISDSEKYLSTLYPSSSMNLLAAVLKENGHEAKALDSLKNYLLTGAGNKNHMFDGLDKMLNSFKPDVVGITMYSPARKVALDLARRVKAFDKNIIVLAGGPHPTRMHRQLAEHYSDIIDYIFIGPSEISLPELVKAIENNTEPNAIGITYNRNGQLHNTGKGAEIDLNTLPIPDYSDYIDMHPNSGLTSAYVMTSRGCTARCRFCSNIWHKPQYREPSQVMSEIEHLVNKCNIQRLIIYDDSFGMKKAHAIQILKGIKKLEADMELLIMTRFDYLDRELLDLYKSAGGEEIFLGIETGSESLRKKMGKRITDNQIYDGASMIKNAGLKTGAFLMFGYLGETREDVIATYSMMEKLDPVQVFVNVTNIKPGDLNFEQGIKDGSLSEEDWLDEDKRLFTFLDDEQLELAVGCTYLFDDTFTRRKSKPDFEATAWIKDGDLAERERLKQSAASWLFGKR